jgi:hypothetical protein
MRQGQHLEHAAIDHLVHHVTGDERTERVEHRLGPRRHLLVLAAGQVAELLAAHGVQRTEHNHPLVRAPLEHRIEPGAQREGGFAGARASAQRHDADLGVEQQVERHPLLGRAAPQPECLPVAADQTHLLVRRDPRQRRALDRVQHETGVAGLVGNPGEVGVVGDLD